MQLARVVGQAVATVKHPSFQGWKLLVAQPLTAEGKEDGEPVLAIDPVGAGRADVVIVTSEGGEARKVIGHKDSPVRWMVLGVCDA